jgi:hypothetical protein
MGGNRGLPVAGKTDIPNRFPAGAGFGNNAAQGSRHRVHRKTNIRIERKDLTVGAVKGTDLGIREKVDPQGKAPGAAGINGIHQGAALAATVIFYRTDIHEGISG